jgi:hypothetical protein
MTNLLQKIQATPRRDLAQSSSEAVEATAVPMAYEPHCLMTWKQQVEGMDDMARFAGQPQ